MSKTKLTLLCVSVLLPTLLLQLNVVLANGTNSGRRFLIVIPPWGVGNLSEQVSLNIFTGGPALVKLVNNHTGVEYSTTIGSFGAGIDKRQTTVFTDVMHWDADVIARRTLEVNASAAVTVSVMVQGDGDGESFTPLPVEAWGTDYVISTLPDFGTTIRSAGGFAIVAAYDSTDVEIHLRGRNASLGTTTAGPLGSVVSRTLNAGDVFMIMGDGASRNGLDVSGTTISCGKPVGVVAFHQGCPVPATAQVPAQSGYVVEWLPPLQAIGRNYIVPSFEDGSVGTAGDFFRIVTIADSTRIVVRSYSPQTGAVTTVDTAVIPRAYTIHDLYPYTSPALFPAGVVGIEATHPILVMQYKVSPEMSLTNAPGRPAGVLVPSTHQGTRRIAFRLPRIVSATGVKVALVFHVTSDTGTHDNLLSSVTVNSNYLSISSMLAGNPPIRNTIDGTNSYWAILSPGSHEYMYLEAPEGVMITATAYALVKGACHAWPLTSACRADVLDLHEPMVTTLQVYDRLRLSADDGRGESATGIAGFMLDWIAPLDNLILESYPLQDLSLVNRRHQYSVWCRPADPARKASGSIIVWDWAGNVASARASISPLRMELPDTSINFGKVRSGSSSTVQLRIINHSQGSANIIVDGIDFVRGQVYSAAIGIPLSIEPGDTIRIPVAFAPELSDADIEYRDTLKLNIRGGPTRRILFSGMGTSPQLQVQALLPDTVVAGRKTPFFLWLYNRSQDTLEVTEVRNLKDPFGAETNLGDMFPSTLSANDSIRITLFVRPNLPGIAQDTVHVVYDNRRRVKPVPLSALAVASTNVSNAVNAGRLPYLFPNPVEGNELQVHSDGKTRLYIATVMGEIVHSHLTEQERESVDISHLRSGYYIIIINGGGMVQHLPFIRISR